MAYEKFDPEDIGLLVAGILASGVMVGIVTVEAFGVSLADTVFSLAGGDVSWAYILSVGTFAGILITNDNTDLLAADGYQKLKDSGMAEYYVYLIIGSAVLLVAWLFFPQIAEFFRSGDVWGLAYMLGVAAAQVAIGWMY